MVGRTRGAIATGLVLVALTFMTLQGLLFYRPLPAIDGYYRFLGLDQPAEVVRDVFGVPRIEAGTLHDLFFLQGYVTAQDRFAQMEAMRSVSGGTRTAAHAVLDQAPSDVRAAVEAYAAGVTKYLEQHTAARALPAEISLSGRRPTAWTAADPLAIMAVYFESSAQSTCIASGKERNARGGTLLAAELATSAPGPGWYEIGLEGSGAKVIGLSLPGVPGVIAGHNGRVAWSFHQTLAVSPGPGQLLGRILTTSQATRVGDVAQGAAENTALGGCVADIEGAVAALPPLQVSRDGSLVGSTGAGPVDQFGPGLSDARSFDVESMRLLLGTPGAIPPYSGARIVIDLADPDGSKASVSSGQSGHRGSFHYRDQAQLWSAGQLHRLAWTREAMARTEGRLVLRPR